MLSTDVQVWQQPSWKICSRIQVSFGFWGRAANAYDKFSRKLAWISRGFGRHVCLPGSPKWRYKQNDETNGRCESGKHFLVKYRHHLEPRMDVIVDKTCQTYNSLPPCQEIDINLAKIVILWVNFRVLAHLAIPFSGPRDPQIRTDPGFRPRPRIQSGLNLSMFH